MGSSQGEPRDEAAGHCGDHGEQHDLYPEGCTQTGGLDSDENAKQWGEDGERIKRFAESVDRAIYTPASNAGLPITILKSFNAPPPAVRDDADADTDGPMGGENVLPADPNDPPPADTTKSEAEWRKAVLTLLAEIRDSLNTPDDI